MLAPRFLAVIRRPTQNYCGKFYQLSKFSSKRDGEVYSDSQLQEQTLFRVTAIESLMKKEGRNYLTDLWKTGVLRFSDLVGFLRDLKVFTDLHHPLLKKYEFDPVDFLSGAKIAFVEVNKAITAPDMIQFSSGKIGRSESAELLNDVVTPRIFDACKKGVQEFGSRGIEASLQEIKVESASIHHISTEIWEPMEPLKVSEEDKSDVTGAIAETRASADESCSLPIDMNYPGYKDGSVIATVQVLYDASETYKHKLAGDSPLEEVTSTRKTKSKWTFEACISGQTEMEWRIVSLGR